MRLICPNCGAQYEVADDVIPDEGRDVQCSNCANTWFEKPHTGGIEAAFSDVEAPAPAAEPQRQELDPAIADILREEAAREAAARKADGDTTFQRQQDLGLDETPEPRKPIEPAPGDAAGFVAPTATSHKELLPDIEEINSSLRPDSDRIDMGATDAVAKQKKKSGFRRGFMFVILILLILAVVYVFAPQISQTVPAAAEPLSRYVETVDGWRLALDAWAREITANVQ